MTAPAPEPAITREALSPPTALPSQWRDIASAPKDGRPLLLLIPYNPEKFSPQECMDVGRWDPESGERGCFRFHGDDGPDDIQPTHWQPLPAPPLVAGTDELNRPRRSASEMALACARLALARIANGDPQAVRLAKVALADLDTLVPTSRVESAPL